MAMWVFGYGSLLWNPGFEPEEAVLARLEDYHRSFCMLSIHHRGTPEEPGLVLALDAAPGAICTGLALKVAAPDEARVLQDLRDRELISSAYYEAHVPLALSDGRGIDALAYIIDPAHEQYCQYPLDEQAQIIARAVGGRGPNPEYLFNTMARFDTLGIRDPDLSALEAKVRALVEGRG